MRRGFRTVSDRKGLGVGNAARDACWGWHRSVGLMGNTGTGINHKSEKDLSIC